MFAVFSFEKAPTEDVNTGAVGATVSTIQVTESGELTNPAAETPRKEKEWLP